MKLHPVTLLLILSLFALSANRVLSYGNDHAANSQSASSEKSCCSREKAPTPCADDSKQHHTSSSCPCDHENGGCHCPGCGMICSAGAALPLEIPLALNAHLYSVLVQKMAFYFADHLPEAVYLPVWQPPKLDV